MLPRQEDNNHDIVTRTSLKAYSGDKKAPLPKLISCQPTATRMDSPIRLVEATLNKTSGTFVVSEVTSNSWPVIILLVSYIPA